MINRIRDVRKQQGLTLADVADRCNPPTTAQTIGRLETGMRNLSLIWMNRIAAALKVEPQSLLRAEDEAVTRFVARLTSDGAEALAKPTEAVMPQTAGTKLALLVEDSNGDYRAGDQIWLTQLDQANFQRGLNRDVLVPRSAGRFAFGRMLDYQADAKGGRVHLLPPGAGQRQMVIDHPAWIGVSEMLVRML